MEERASAYGHERKVAAARAGTQFARSYGGWAVTLIWGFDIPTLAGFAVGYGYVAACYFYLARCCERAVELDAAKGKRVMLVCYGVRYAGLFALSAFAMLTHLLNVIGILMPQFFPRIVLTAKELFIKKKGSD